MVTTFPWLAAARTRSQFTSTARACRTWSKPSSSTKRSNAPRGPFGGTREALGRSLGLLSDVVDRGLDIGIRQRCATALGRHCALAFDNARSQRVRTLLEQRRPLRLIAELEGTSHPLFVAGSACLVVHFL